MVKRRTQVKNEIQAVLHRNLIERPKVADLFGAKGRRWLAALRLADDEQLTLDGALRQLEFLDGELARLEREIAERVVDDADVRRLMTISGVDVITAATLKPLLAVLRTQSHPIITAGSSSSSPATRSRSSRRRRFPNTVVLDGEHVTFDGARFTAIDLGPSESSHNSPWLLGNDQRTVFLGDQIYDHVHCLPRRPLPGAVAGQHGPTAPSAPARRGGARRPRGPVDADAWDWQRAYIETFVEAVSGADWGDPSSARERRRDDDRLPADGPPAAPH